MCKASFPSRMLEKLSFVFLLGLVAWAYQAIQPPSPRICGSPNGPPITSPRIKLKDGRHLSYLEHGVPKNKARHEIIFVHGFDNCRYDVLPVSQGMLEELGVYLVSFDRAGYGESDPNPKMTEKSISSDIEELAGHLELGSKFYVIGSSMGGKLVWSCLKFIPNRLAGVAIIAPVANYWWSSFPANISKVFYQQLVQDQWALRVAYHAPWLTYWWNTQKWFPSSSVIDTSPQLFSNTDKILLPKIASRHTHQAQRRQQGEFNCLHRDILLNFGKWDLDPMELDNPFEMNESSVHLWHGVDDLFVPVTISRYISRKLPWIHYHEINDAGHMFTYMDDMSDTIVKVLLLGDS